MIVLPERIYKSDCVVVDYRSEEYVRVEIQRIKFEADIGMRYLPLFLFTTISYNTDQFSDVRSR